MNLKVIVSAVVVSGVMTIGLMASTGSDGSKPKRVIQVKYLSDRQIYLNCRDGSSPNMASVSGSLVISCDPPALVPDGPPVPAPKKSILDDFSVTGAD